MKISQKIFKLPSGHKYMMEITIHVVQRTETPKVGKPELWCLCSAHCFIVLCICVKFHENISNGFQVTGQTRVYDKEHYLQCSMGHNSKSRKNRVVVLMFCKSSHGVLYICISGKLSWFSSYRADTI